MDTLEEGTCCPVPWSSRARSGAHNSIISRQRAPPWEAGRSHRRGGRIPCRHPEQRARPDTVDDFTPATIETAETGVFGPVRSGLLVLLLHGFPQTHLIGAASPRCSARNFTVICADLRGYGRSGCPASATDHAPYAKRSMAREMLTVMERLGFLRFAVAGHDRGGRVAYRMALDDPDRVDRLAVLDILPTETVWERADARFALG